MTDPIFALPRHEYASYRDLYRLITLSGFPTCYIDDIDAASDNTYVMTIANGENQAGWVDPRADIYLLDLEWHLDGIHIPGVKAVWAGDQWYADTIGVKYVPIGSHAGLADNGAFPDYAPHYDVAFIGYFAGVPRRQVIRQQLIERGVQVSPTGAWGDERHTVLANSAAYLCVHQLEAAPTIAPLRMVVAAAYSLPVISEAVADAGVFTKLILTPDYALLASNVAELVSNKVLWKPLSRYGEYLHQFLCEEMTFRKSIEAAL